MRKKDPGAAPDLPQQAQFMQLVVNQVDPKFLVDLVKTSPDMVLAMLQTMDPAALAQVVNGNPEVFGGFFSSMPRALMRRLLTETPDLIFDMLRLVDVEIVLDMMGLAEK